MNALFRRIPVRIPAIHYGYEGEGRSFGRQGMPEWKSGYRGDDGMEIRYLDGRPRLPPETPGWHRWDTEGGLCLELKPGEWAAYDFTVRSDGGDVAGGVDLGTVYRLVLQLGTPAGAGVAAVTLDGRPLAELRPGTAWERIAAADRLPALEAGTHRVVVAAREGAVRVESLSFEA
ncbi:hypothetical protein [Cohnella sp. REN36]|uniref:hypothetical protein n=1 Tax=Cohnella sp. REN36 TaxID=2887347 RepID=UPI00351D9F96